MKYKIGDRVKNVKGSAIVFEGVISGTTRGGDEIGFPWRDDTTHYKIIDEKTGVLVISHPKSMQYV